MFCSKDLIALMAILIRSSSWALWVSQRPEPPKKMTETEKLMAENNRLLAEAVERLKHIEELSDYEKQKTQNNEL